MLQIRKRMRRRRRKIMYFGNYEEVDDIERAKKKVDR